MGAEDMMGFGVVQAVPGAGLLEPPTFELDGLTYVSDTALRVMEQALRAMTLQLKWTNHTFGARAIPGIGKESAWDSLERWSDQGYVTMIEKASPTDFLISNSAVDVAHGAKSGATHAILKGPPTMLQAATTAAAVKAVPAAAWLLPVAIIGALALVFVFRR